jgi:hypothetical protein
MNRLHQWLRATACPVLDRARDEQISALARQVIKCMRREGSFFSFHDTATLMNVPLEDLVLVQERVYELTLKHVMEDFRINRRDRGGLGWIARNLKIEAKDARRIELRVGRQVFEEYLAFSIAGGRLTEDEIAEFQALAESLSITTRQLLVLYLAESGEDFLGMVLDMMAEQQNIDRATWEQLTASLNALGLDERELVRVLRAQGPRLASHLAGISRPSEAQRDRQRLLVILLTWLDRHAGG